MRSAGVTVGRVASIALDAKTYQGVVRLEVDRGVQFPKDSSARILTAGLLGDQYIGLEPGADEKNLGRRRHDHADAVGRGAGEPDQPVPVQQGGRCRDRGADAGGSQEVKSRRSARRRWRA